MLFFDYLIQINDLDNFLLFAMDPTRASYARYWEPSLIQTLGFSMLPGAFATAATYPVEYIKTVTQFRCEGVGLRGDRWKRTKIN